MNERDSIQALLDSLLSQTRPAAEIVIVDGGSDDGTYEVIQAAAARNSALTALQEPGANISAGRNVAIRAAAHEAILVTDAGVRLQPDWVERLASPLLADPAVDMVGGFFESAPESTFEWALGATTLPALEDINPGQFMPSHRSVAFRRSVWSALGGYPEWLDYCEDLLFDMRARDRGLRIDFEPRATVAFRPRSSLNAFFLQYLRYARGDGKARILIKRHLLRYALYGGAVGCLSLIMQQPSALRVLMLPAGVLGGAYCARPWQRLWRTRGQHSLRSLACAALWVPLIRVSGDMAKMSGFPFGLRYRRAARA